MRNADVPKWMLKRLPEVQVVRKGDEVTVILPKDIKWWEAGLLIDEALMRAGLHPNQLDERLVPLDEINQLAS